MLSISEMPDAVIESVEKVSLVVARYCKAEDVFYSRNTKPEGESATRLIRLYCRIFRYQVDLQYIASDRMSYS